MLVVFAEPTRASQPGKSAFDDPASREQLEAMDGLVVSDDLQTGATARAQGPNPVDEGAGIAAVGPDAPQPAEAFPQGGQ